MHAVIKQDIIKEIKGLLEFPNAKICRHFVALDLISILEKHGCQIPVRLVKAISDGCEGDQIAMEELKNL